MQKTTSSNFSFFHAGQLCDQILFNEYSKNISVWTDEILAKREPNPLYIWDNFLLKLKKEDFETSELDDVKLVSAKAEEAKRVGDYRDKKVQAQALLRDLDLKVRKLQLLESR